VAVGTLFSEISTWSDAKGEIHIATIAFRYVEATMVTN
jgi:hypothetical protein